MNTNAIRAYRGVLREIGRTAIQPRGQRNTAILGMLRSIVSDPQATASPTFEREMMEMKEFLKAGRIHSELLIRYNPLHDMSAEERVNATARRVGLDVKRYDGSGGSE